MRLGVGILRPQPPQGRLADVRGDHPGAVGEQLAHQPPADLADAADGHPPARQRRHAPQVPGAGAHPLEHAVGGQDAGVARAAVRGGASGDPPALPRDHVHVLDVRADVAGGDVAAAERRHETPVRAQQRLGLVPPGVAEDDRLAAAEVQAGAGGLVGHGPGQGKGVAQGHVLVGVGVESGPAEGGAEGGRVDRDDRAQPAGGVHAEDHLFVLRTGGEDGRHR